MPDPMYEDVNLSEFVRIMNKLLVHFENDWIKNNAKDPVTYPMIMDFADFYEQFHIYEPGEDIDWYFKEGGE